MKGFLSCLVPDPAVTGREVAQCQELDKGVVSFAFADLHMEDALGGATPPGSTKPQVLDTHGSYRRAMFNQANRLHHKTAK